MVPVHLCSCGNTMLVQTQQKMPTCGDRMLATGQWTCIASAVSSARCVLFSPGAQFDLKGRKQARMGDRWKRPFETDSDHRKSGVRYDHRDDEWGAWGYWGRNKADDQSGSEEDVSSIQAAPILNLSLKQARAAKLTIYPRC